MTENTKPEVPAAKPPRDLRQELTDKLVQSLEQGQIPWNKPWVGQGLPRNMETGREYRGGNRFMLLLEQAGRGYADPRYGTVKQINALGGRVKKGERGLSVELWKEQPFYERKDISVTLNGMRVKVFAEKNGMAQVGVPTDKDATLRVKTSDLRVEQRTKDGQQDLSWAKARELDTWTARVHTVFNVAQCDGLKIEPLAPAPNFDTVARGESIKAAMEKDGLKFAEHPKHAFYSPKRDEVSLPPRGAFNSEPGKDDGAARYYGTLLHEIGHATGAAHRLNREGITGGHRFGSEGYAKEELRAEMFSMFAAAQTGIPYDGERHTAYVQDWAKVLKNDKNEIFRAAAEAGKAVDYVLDKEQSLQVTQERQASARAAELAAQALGGHVGQRELRRESIDNLNPDLRLGVEGYSFLAMDKGPGAYAFDAFADIINARYDSPQARVIADAFRAVPDGVLTVHANRTVSIDLPVAHDQVPQREETPRQPTLRETLEDAGWKFKAATRAYEKTFVITKDEGRGGEFTHGKSEVEKVLIAKTPAQGLVIEHGWDDLPVPGTAGVAPKDAVRLLDAAAKERLATTHAHLGVVTVRGANEPAEEQSVGKGQQSTQLSDPGKYFQQIENDLDRQVNGILDHAREPAGQQSAEQEQVRTVRGVFVHKPGDGERLVERLSSEEKRLKKPEQAKVVASRDMSASDYDAFVEDLFNDHDFLKGQGGIETLADGSRQRQVIEVTAKDRQTLLIDPSGHGYARIAGEPEADLERVLESGSLKIGEVSQGRQKGLASPDKAPHELTFAEFSAVANPVKLGPDHGRQWEVFNGKESLGFADGPTEEGALRQVHKREVNNALYGNQPDAPAYLHTSMPPAHVLAEYPDLQKQFAGVIEAKQPALAFAQEPMARTNSEAQKPSAYDQAIQNFIKGGRGAEEQARRLLDGAMEGDIDAKRLGSALMYHGFAPIGASEKLAATILAEENQKVLAKEDRKASEFHVAQQADEAFGKDKPNGAERSAEKRPVEPEADKPERPARPRLRQTTRKSAAMER